MLIRHEYRPRPIQTLYELSRDTFWQMNLDNLKRYLEAKMTTDLNRRAARAVTHGDTILATVDVAMSPERVSRALITNEIEACDEVSAIIAEFGAQLKDPAKPFTLLVRFQVREGAQEEIEAAFARARTPTSKEEGVMTYHLNREAKDASRFVVYERWRSLADLEAHLRTPYITTLRNEFNSMIAGVPDFHMLIPAEG